MCTAHGLWTYRHCCCYTERNFITHRNVLRDCNQFGWAAMQLLYTKQNVNRISERNNVRQLRVLLCVSLNFCCYFLFVEHQKCNKTIAPQECVCLDFRLVFSFCCVWCRVVFSARFVDCFRINKVQLVSVDKETPTGTTK